MDQEHNPGKDSAKERKENHGGTEIRQDDFPSLETRSFGMRRCVSDLA